MKLQILINHYQEPLEVLERLLFSIMKQKISEKDSVEVLICTDGYENEIQDHFFNQYRYPVRYYVKPHYGVCKTRNSLLDVAVADYVMFCDTDDVFSDSYGLHKLIEAAKETDSDIIGSDYDCEVLSDNDFLYVKMHKDMIRVHGKIFKRSYLIREGLHFPDEMEFSGDMYFLWLAYHLTDKIVWLPDSFYIWKWNPFSITRSEKWHSIRAYGHALKCYSLVINELIRRNRTELYSELIATSFSTSYIDWFSEKFEKAPAEYVASAKVAIKQSVLSFRPYYDAMPEKTRKKIYNSILFQKRTYGPTTKFIGMQDWLDNIMDKT